MIAQLHSERGYKLHQQKGEISLVVVKGGQDLGLLSSFVFPLMGVVTIITTFITPYIFKLSLILRLSSTGSGGGEQSDQP